MQHQTIIKSVKLDAASRKQIEAAEKQLEALDEILLDTAEDNPFRRSRLSAIADKAGNAFNENPTPELAEAWHQAIVRAETAKLSGPWIGEHCHAKRDSIGRSLASVSAAILDSAVQAVESQLAIALESVKSDPSIFNSESAVRAQAAELLAGIQGQREHSQSDPLRFLVNNGYSAALV